MLYLAIDQHRKQLTVNLRNEAGDVILKRQVSTEWKRVREFLVEVQNLGHPTKAGSGLRFALSVLQLAPLCGIKVQSSTARLRNRTHNILRLNGNAHHNIL